MLSGLWGWSRAMPSISSSTARTNSKMLPGTDGIELMKDTLDVEDAPVIFLSVYGREEAIARDFDMGAAEYVVKPPHADGARGADQGGLADAGDRKAVGAVRAGRTDDRLLRTQSDRRPSPATVDRDEIRDAG